MKSDRVRITDSTFINNKAFDGLGGGGGIVVTQTGFTVTNCIFANNSATVGGAILASTNATGIPSIATITNCSFYENWARRTNLTQTPRPSYGGAVVLSGNYSGFISDSRIENSTGAGGAVTAFGSSLNVTGCYFGKFHTPPC